MDTKYAYYSTSKGYRVVGGTAAHFLKADGSLDNNSYALVNLTVPYTGATSDLTLADKNLNFTSGSISKFENALRVFNKVFHKTYVNVAQIGIISFKFPAPTTSATMFTVDINYYDYGTRSLGKLRVGFYRQTSAIIHNSGRIALWECSDNLPSSVINIGIDLAGNICINLGEITTNWGTYTHFEVERVQTSFTGGNFDWSKGWTQVTETVAPVVPDTYQILVNIVPEIVATRTHIENTLLLGRVPDKSISLGTSDLNTITTPGFYNQAANANATLVRNYPTTLAGTLNVYRSTGNGFVQEYTAYSNPITYKRIFGGTQWSSWAQIIDSANGGTILADLTVTKAAGGTINIGTDKAAGSTASPRPMNLNFLGYTDIVKARISSNDIGVNSALSPLIFHTYNTGGLQESMRIQGNGNIDFVGNLNRTSGELTIQKNGVNKIRTGGSAGNSLILSGEGSDGAIYLRPLGDTNQTSEVYINSSGVITTTTTGNSNQWNNVSQAFITNPFFRGNSIVSQPVGTTAVTTLDSFLPNGGFITNYGIASWGGSDAPAGATFGGFIKFTDPNDQNGLQLYYNNGHGSSITHRLWFRTKNATVGSTNWFEVLTSANGVPYTGAINDLSLADKNLNFTSGSISRLENAMRTFTNVFQKSNGVAQTGIISFKFPLASAATTMFDVTINLYGYGTRTLAKLRLGFYKNSATTLTITGSKALWETSDILPSTVINVGLDASNNICINLGESTTDWGIYTHFEVEKLKVGHSGYNADWSKGWSQIIETDTSTYQSIVNIVPDIVATRSYIENTLLVGRVPDIVINLALTDLNTVLTPGFYRQLADVNATPARNYPVQNAGSLNVYRSISNGIVQEYTAYNTGTTYKRVYTGTQWVAWKTVLNSVDTIPQLANYVTTNTDQTTITGNKATAGTFTFNNNIISNAQFLEGANFIKSRWLTTGSINTNNKVAYLVIEGFTADTNRQLVIEVESIAGNGQYKKLKKVFNVNFNSTNDLNINGSKYVEITGRDVDIRYGIGEVEKLSNTSLRIPIIWLSSNSTNTNQITIKTAVGEIRNLSFSITYDATSTLTTEVPLNNLVGTQILVNNDAFAGGIDISGGNTIYLRNLLPSTRQDANVRILRNELSSYTTNSGSTNYPVQIGSGIRSERYSSATDQRGFDIFTNGSSGLFFKTFSASATESNWEMFASREWTVLQLGSYVTQASLITQLGNFATLNGVQSFTKTNTFEQNIIIPDATLINHAVNLGVLSNSIDESQGQILGYVGSNYIPLSQKGSANGVATLDASGLIPSTQLPSYVDDVIEASNLAALNAFPANEKQTGKIYVTTDTNKSYRWSGSVFVEISSGAVQSVNGQTGIVNLTHSDVGAAQLNHTHTIAQISGLQSALDGKVDDAQVLTNVPAGALFTDTIYTLPTATSTVKGGVEIFSDTVQAVASNSVTNIANRTYGIQLNSAGQAVVNVPWSNDNTTYTAGNGLTLSGTVFSLPITISGSGNYITDVTQNTNGITVTKGTLPSYTLLVSTSNSLGGVRLITDTVNNVAPNAATTTVGRSYAVQLNNSNQAIVNVPWTDNNTTYTSSNGIVLTGTNFAPTFGTTANTIAQGNDSRINNGQTAFGWDNHAIMGYAKLASAQTFTGTNTFSVSPMIPNATLPVHPVNLGQLSGILSGSYVSQNYLENNFIKTPDGYTVLLSSGTNLNDNLKTGLYRGEQLVNAPNSGWWYISVESHDFNWRTQRAISFGSNNVGNLIYQRTLNYDGWTDWVQIWTTQDFTTTNIQQWNYMAQYGLQLNADFTVHTGAGLMISDDHFGGESGIIDNKQRRFVAAKIGEYYKYGSGDKDGLEGINFHLEKKNVGIGGDADSENKVRVQGCVKALENFKSKDERPDTMFIPNGETATLRDEIINDESEYAIRLDPHEYEIDPSGYLEVDDRNRLIHVIGEQIKMVVNFRKIYPKQQIVIYNFDQNGGTMAVKIQGKIIASLSARCFLRLYVTKSSRVIAERQQPCDFVW